MFHAVLQKNEEVLRNLLATLLEMDEADILDKPVVIVLGEGI